MNRIQRFVKCNLSMKIIWTLIITILSLFLVVSFAGGGHGTYLPAKLMYPFSMLAAEFEGQIGFGAIMLAIVQIPTYVLILNIKSNWKYCLIGIHLLAVLVLVNIKSGSF